MKVISSISDAVCGLQAAVEVPQYVGVSLLVEGFKIKCPCPLPPLRSFTRSAPKRRGSIKEKRPAADETKRLPKIKTQLKTTCSVVPPPSLLHLELPVPIPVETFTLRLPMTVKSTHLPLSAQPYPEFVQKRKSEVSEVCSEKDQCPALTVEIVVPKQSRPAATSTMSA